jgi:hypothetical protein
MHHPHPHSMQLYLPVKVPVMPDCTVRCGFAGV